MNNLINACLLCASFWFCSCTHFTLETLDRYKKGMTTDQVKDITPYQPENEITITYNTSTKVNILVYILSVGSYKSNYFVAFRNEKLIYWGYPHEFSRVSDPFLNEIGILAVDEYSKNK